MKGTIRIVAGLILTLGGVGGIEQSMELLPLDSLAIALVGLALFAWGALDAAREEQNV